MYLFFFSSEFSLSFQAKLDTSSRTTTAGKQIKRKFKTTIDASWSLKVMIGVSAPLQIQIPQTITGEHQDQLSN